MDTVLLKRDTCETDNEYDGNIGIRVSAIFVILVAGTFGSLFPILASTRSLNIPDAAFFAAKYFGSGVIIATSLIHLLQPANEALTNECLGAGWDVYPYAFGICLFVIFLTFFVELLSQRHLSKVGLEHTHGPAGLIPDHEHGIGGALHTHNHGSHEEASDNEFDGGVGNTKELDGNQVAVGRASVTSSSGCQHSHGHNHGMAAHSVASQLGAIFILEFGIIFHSIFIGLTLAVSGDEFKTLYIVLCFHQLFEGLGLGTRLATAPWPENKRKWLPWALGILFGLTTPIAIAIGLGLRKSYPPGSATALICNGIFDSISAGILLYTGLVELIANEFLHSPDFKTASTARVLMAFFIMCLGAGLMALLGRWA